MPRSVRVARTRTHEEDDVEPDDVQSDAEALEETFVPSEESTDEEDTKIRWTHFKRTKVKILIEDIVGSNHGPFENHVHSECMMSSSDDFTVKLWDCSSGECFTGRNFRQQILSPR